MKDTWGTTYTNEELKDFVGFVYIITEKKSDKKYVGIKKFWTKKGKPTNWRTYISSSAKLKGLDVNNKRKFKKDIFLLCETITEMKATEAWIQLDFYMQGRWHELFNEMINVRLRIRK